MVGACCGLPGDSFPELPKPPVNSEITNKTAKIAVHDFHTVAGENSTVIFLFVFSFDSVLLSFMRQITS